MYVVLNYQKIGQRNTNFLEELLIGVEGEIKKKKKKKSHLERFSILMCQNILIQIQMGIHHSRGFTQLQVNN